MKKTVLHISSFAAFVFVFLFLIFLQSTMASDSQVGFDYTLEEGELYVDIVDGISGEPEPTPMVDFGEGAFSNEPSLADGVLGTEEESVRVFNYTNNPAWTLNIAAENVEHAWSSDTDSYSYNHPTDAELGRLTVNPALANILSDVGCDITHLSSGAEATFKYGDVDSIDLMSASADAPNFCRFDLRDVILDQIIPASQPVGVYSLGMVLTVSASGEVDTFDCGSDLVDDRDSQTYSTVEIGDQCWMAENLNYDAHTTGESECYDDDVSNCATYGRLYSWDAANDVCPTGWHLPSDNEWQGLEVELGMTSGLGAEQDVTQRDSGSVGEQLKDDQSWDGTNTSGFTALPGGSLFADPGWGIRDYTGVGTFGHYWTSTDYWYRIMRTDEVGIGRTNETHDYDYMYYSVRCILDEV